MLLYIGGGAALADYYRRRRALLLADCAAACAELSRSSIERLGTRGEDDRAALAVAIASAEDCRDVFARAAALVTRGSELTGCILLACVEACLRCAEACEPLSTDQAATRCALACRRAEEICRRAIGATAG